MRQKSRPMKERAHCTVIDIILGSHECQKTAPSSTVSEALAYRHNNLMMSPRLRQNAKSEPE